MSSNFFDLRLPNEPSPLPTMPSDDEESFVVLGKSLISDVDLSFKSLEVSSNLPLDHAEKIEKIIEKLEKSTTSVQDVTLSVATNSSDLSLQDVQAKVDSLIAENNKLRETIIKNNSVMEAEHEKFVEWKEEVQKTHQTHKIKFAEAKEYITKLKAENEFLTSELEKSNEIKELQQNELFELKNVIQNFKKENKSHFNDNPSSSKIENEDLQSKKNESIVAQKIEVEKLITTLNASKDKIVRENQEIKLENENFSKLILEKNGEIEKLNKNLSELKEKHENQMKLLNNELIDLKSKLCISVNIQEDLDNVRKQLMSSQATITNLHQEKAVLITELSKEQAKVKELQNLDVLKDEHFALLEQVNQYKADFEAERTQNEKLTAEKEQIMSDFLQIQKRNNELNEELEIVKERGFVSVHQRSSNSSSSNNGAAFNQSINENRSSDGEPYKCPLCQFGFTTIQACENHVERCLEMTSALP